MTPGGVSYWCQTVPVPSVPIKAPLKAYDTRPACIKVHTVLKMSTVSMHCLHDSSTVSSIDSCHSKEYSENISLTSLTLSRSGASHTAQEKIRVLWCACVEVVNLWVWLPFRFSFTSTRTWPHLERQWQSLRCVCRVSTPWPHWYSTIFVGNC